MERISFIALRSICSYPKNNVLSVLHIWSIYLSIYLSKSRFTRCAEKLSKQPRRELSLFEGLKNLKKQNLKYFVYFKRNVWNSRYRETYYFPFSSNRKERGASFSNFFKPSTGSFCFLVRQGTANLFQSNHIYLSIYLSKPISLFLSLYETCRFRLIEPMRYH